MNITQFRDALAAHADLPLRVELPGGSLPDHFHVTEVGRVQKDFIDCGGVLRSEVRCVLQTLVAGDTDHRLRSGKLARIVAMADKLDIPADSPVEVEHQERSVSTDAVVGVALHDGALVIRLAAKQTACLAEDACGIPSAAPAGLTVLAEGCCTSPGCC